MRNDLIKTGGREQKLGLADLGPPIFVDTLDGAEPRAREAFVDLVSRRVRQIPVREPVRISRRTS